MEKHGLYFRQKRNRPADEQNLPNLLNRDEILGISYFVLISGYPVYKSLTPG